MSGRGIDFLENWVNKNITVVDRKSSQGRATGLAAQCYANVAAQKDYGPGLGANPPGP